MANETTSSLPVAYTSDRFNTGDTISNILFGTSPQALISSRGTLSPEQEAMLRRLLANLGGNLTGTPYGGELTAGLGDLEGLSLEALEQKILQRATGEGVGADTEKALSEMLRTGGAPTDFEDYYQKSIRDPLVQDFSELVLPELTRRYGSSGAFGSDRMLAEQQVTERLGKTLAGARGELAFKTQESASDRVLKALGLSPGIQTGGVEDILKLLQGAGLPRQVEQTRLTSEYGEFQRQETERQQRVAQILAALGVKTKENIPQNLPGSSGILGGMLSRGSKGGFF